MDLINLISKYVKTQSEVAENISSNRTLMLLEMENGMLPTKWSSDKDILEVSKQEAIEDVVDLLVKANPQSLLEVRTTAVSVIYSYKMASQSLVKNLYGKLPKSDWFRYQGYLIIWENLLKDLDATST